MYRLLKETIIKKKICFTACQSKAATDVYFEIQYGLSYKRKLEPINWSIMITIRIL